jgi:hypothetical protein
MTPTILAFLPHMSDNLKLGLNGFKTRGRIHINFMTYKWDQYARMLHYTTMERFVRNKHPSF